MSQGSGARSSPSAGQWKGPGKDDGRDTKTRTGRGAGQEVEEPQTQAKPPPPAPPPHPTPATPRLASGRETLRREGATGIRAVKVVSEARGQVRRRNRGLRTVGGGGRRLVIFVRTRLGARVTFCQRNERL